MKQMIFGVAIIAAMPFHFFKRHRSMKAVFYILSSIIGLTSCMERPDNSMIGLFKNKSNEQTKISQIKTDSVRNPYIMNYHNGMLVFGDIFQSKFISIFDGYNGDFLGDFASQGVGPDEFVHIGNISCINDKISLWDAGKSTLTFAGIDHNNILSPTFQNIKIKEDTTLLSVFQVIPLQEDLFVATGIIKNHRFALLDKNGNILKRFGNYPKDYKPNNTDIENGAIYQCLLTSQNEKKVFAAACGIGESIMFYDINNKNNPHLIREFTFDHPQYDLTGDNEQPVIFSKDSKNGFIDIKSSSNYCICLFSGEVRTGVNDYGGNKILIFDWKGNPIKLIVLEQQYTNLAIDEENKRILLLGTSSETKDYIISEIELPE